MEDKDNRFQVKFENGSILHYLLMVGITFVLVVVIIFTGIYLTIIRQSRDNAVLVDYFMNVNSVLSKLYDMKTSVTVLNRNEWNKEMITDHIALSELLDCEIDEFEDRYELDEYSSNILRRLKGLNDFQRNLVLSEQDDVNFYFNTKYIQDALDAHIAEFYHLMQHESADSLTDYTEREKKTIDEIRALISILFISIIIAFVVYSRFNLSIRRSLKETIDNLHSIAKHEWNAVDLSVSDGFEEFRELAREVNNEKKELETYFKEQEKRRELEVRLVEKERDSEITKQLLVTTEMEMLKSQINPHFIFNSLHQIGMATLLKEPKDVLQMVEYTGNILRYSLYNKDSLVELDEELYIVKQYIGLLQICSPDLVEMEIEDNTVDDGIPKKILPMCIQPIVENSIKHAGGDDRTLRIDIRIEETEDSLVVNITDDGEGIADVDHVLEKSRKSIGLKNISRRLSLVYGRMT